MNRESPDVLERPFTHVVGIDQAMAMLDYDEMSALAWQFEYWAFNDPKLDDDCRTKWIQIAADYERIAAFSGEGWGASDKENPPSLMAFIARRTLSELGKESVDE